MTAPTAERAKFGHPHQMPFTSHEFEARQAKVRNELAQRGLDGLLVSRIEDQYWLCGLDTTGYTIFHCMFIGVNGELTHLSRSADLANIAYSSICDDVRLWDDRHGNSRASGIRDLLASHNMQGKRVGVQLDTFGMLPDLYLELTDAVEDWCTLVPASDLIPELRMPKSAQELTYMRRAGEILTEATTAAIASTFPGAFEGDILGEFNRTLLSRDADICAEPNWPMGSGPRALLVRHATGHGYIGENDQVTYEPGVAYRHYNVASMFTVLTGPKINPRHLAMHHACVDALAAVQALLRSGHALGELYAEHKRVLTAHGFGHATLLACGYPMGAGWPPTWMDRPMITEDHPYVLAPGMTFFTHMILTDRDAGLTMSLGETVAVTDGDPDVLSAVPREPLIHAA